MAIRKPNQPNRTRKTEAIEPDTSGRTGNRNGKGLDTDHLASDDGFKVGQVLGKRFKLTRQIGSGAMGAVFEAHDQHLGETICVKALAAPKFSEQMVEERLRRELLVSRKLNHPNICRAYDHLSEGSKRFLVMELVRGRTLRDVMKQDGRPRSSKAFELVETLLDALGAAHRAGVIHRDIKPDNIMLSDEGRLVLLDFGISLDREMSRLTAPGLVLGSKRFVAPELWRGHAPTPGVDVWAVGVIFFYLLTNTFPFSGNMVLSSVRDRVALDIPLLREVRPSASAAFEKVLFRMLAIDPAKRYQNADDALAALRKANDIRIRSRKKTRDAAIEAAKTRVSPSKAPKLATQEQSQTGLNGRASGSGERFFDVDKHGLKDDIDDAETTRANNMFQETVKLSRRAPTPNDARPAFAKTLVDRRHARRTVRERSAGRASARAAMAFAAVLLFATNTQGEAHASPAPVSDAQSVRSHASAATDTARTTSPRPSTSKSSSVRTKTRRVGATAKSSARASKKVSKRRKRLRKTRSKRTNRR